MRVETVIREISVMRTTQGKKLPSRDPRGGSATGSSSWGGGVPGASPSGPSSPPFGPRSAEDRI